MPSLTSLEGKVVLRRRKSGQHTEKVVALKGVGGRRSPVVASVGRRKITKIRGWAFIECQSEFHIGDRLRMVTDFPVQRSKGGLYLATRCRSCDLIYKFHYKKRSGLSSRNLPGRVRVEVMRPYLKEIVERTGGVLPAARALGFVGTASIYRWLGGNPAYIREHGKQEYMITDNAFLILNLFQKLRRE